MTTGVQWHMKGSLLAGCNCDWGCPCNFNAPPTYGNCEGPYVWYIDEGRLGDVSLDGFWVCIAQAFPGALHEGQGTCQFIIDARADDRERESLLTLLNGDVGGGFEIFASITDTFLETIYGNFEGEIKGLDSWVAVPGYLELRLSLIKNPVTGDVEEVKLVKPTGITSFESDMGTSLVCRYTGGIQHDHPDKYAEFAPFEYSSS